MPVFHACGDKEGAQRNGTFLPDFQNTPDLDRAPQADEAQDRHGAGETPPAGAFEELQHWCGQCRAVLPSAHLLDLHLSEVHDSFFAAQAARGMRVYVCLVEGCPYRSASVTERRAHLLEQHGISDALDLNVVHLRCVWLVIRGRGRGRRRGKRAVADVRAAPLIRVHDQ